MKTIKVKDYPKFQGETFLHVFRGGNPTFKKGDTVRFVEFPNEDHIKDALCIDVKIMCLGELPAMFSYLDMDCDLEIYFAIWEARKAFKTDLITVACFTEHSNSREYVTKKIKEYQNY